MVEMGVGTGLRQLVRGVLVLVVPFQQVGLCGGVVDGKDARRPSRGGGQLRGSEGRVVVGRETEEWYCDPGHCWFVGGVPRCVTSCVSNGTGRKVVPLCLCGLFA